MQRNSHILITGANGFLGRHLSSALLSTGTKVTQLVHTIAPEHHKTDIKIALDLTDRNKVIEVFTNLQPDYVIHLASTKDRMNTGMQFRNSYETNLSISLNVIEACLGLYDFKRLIFLGTCDEYGQTTCPFVETQRELPVNTYGLSKLAVTQLLSGLYQSHQFPSVVLRPSVIYGPNQGNEMFLPALIQSLLAKKDFAMTFGEQFRDFVYVNDVVDAIIKTLLAGEQVNGSIINIGAGVSYQVKKVALIVADLIKPTAKSHLKLGVVQYRPNEAMDYAINISLAKQSLDWQPLTTLTQGLQHTINHFKEKVINGNKIVDKHA